MMREIITDIVNYIIDTSLIAYYIAFIVAEYRILQKEGEKGWKSLIPIYNFYVTYKIEGVFIPWFYFAATCYLIESAESCFEIFQIHVPLAVELIFAAASVLMIITESVFSVNLGRSFGKSTGFKVGLVLLPEIFYLVLAFGKSEFIHHVHHTEGDTDAGLPDSKA